MYLLEEQQRKGYHYVFVLPPSFYPSIPPSFFSLSPSFYSFFLFLSLPFPFFFYSIILSNYLSIKLSIHHLSVICVNMRMKYCCYLC